MSDFSDIRSQLYFLLKNKNIKHMQHGHHVVSMWTNIVGDLVAKNTVPNRFINGILYVDVKSSAWKNEISFIKEDIIDKYRTALQKDIVKDIKLYVGNKAPPLNYKSHFRQGKPEFADPLKSKKYIRTEALTIKEKDDIDAKTEAITDDRLKNSLNKFLQKSRERELALLKQGWKRCSKCKCLHNENNGLCKSCKVSF